MSHSDFTNTANEAGDIPWLDARLYIPKFYDSKFNKSMARGEELEVNARTTLSTCLTIHRHRLAGLDLIFLHDPGLLDFNSSTPGLLAHGAGFLEAMRVILKQPCQVVSRMGLAAAFGDFLLRTLDLHELWLRITSKLTGK